MIIALVIAAGAFEPFYLRVFRVDRAKLRANLVELPYRKLPGLREMLVATRERTSEGDTIAVIAPFGWEQGYEYIYARSLYTLAGRKVQRELAGAQWILAYGMTPQGNIVWQSNHAALLHVGPPPPAANAAVEGGATSRPEITYIALVWITGFALALLIDRKAAGALLAAESLLFGIAASSALLMLIPWGRTAFITGMVVTGVAAFTITLKVKRTPQELGTRPPAPGRTIVNVLTIVLMAGYTRWATAGPLWEFDFLVDWGLKAREFFLARGIDWRFLEAAWYRGTHPDYPPLLPLAFDAATILRGAWSDHYLGILNVAFAAGLLLVIYRLSQSAFVTLAMVPLAATPWIGLAESPFIAYATAGLLLMCVNPTAAAVMLGCAALTKNEGASLIVAVALALLVTRQARVVPRLWPALAIPVPWWIMRGMHHLPTDITSGNVLMRVMQHIAEPTVFEALLHYSLGKPLFWIGIAGGIAYTFRRLDRFVMTALALQLLFYIGAYLATPHDVAWHVQWSWERLIAHLTPALTFTVMTALWRRPGEGASRTFSPRGGEKDDNGTGMQVGPRTAERGEGGRRPGEGKSA